MTSLMLSMKFIDFIDVIKMFISVSDNHKKVTR